MMIYLEANCISRGDIAQVKAETVNSKRADCIDTVCPLYMSCPKDIRLEKKVDKGPPQEIIFIAKPVFN